MISEHDLAPVVVAILARKTSRRATFAELFEAVPHEIALSDVDRAPSRSRPNEELWQVRLRNIASHARPDGSTRHPQLVRTECGLRLRERPPETKKDVEEEIQEEQKSYGFGNLKDFKPFEKNDWPQCAGVYILYDGCQRVTYVGQGENIAVRLRDHEEKYWYRNPSVAYGSFIEIKDKHMRLQLEKVLIKVQKINILMNKQFVERFDHEYERAQ
jgi:hypothetical protein